MRFTGNIDAKTDAKGRLFLPAVFRKILQANGEDTLILRRDVFQACLVLYPESVWNQVVDTITARTGKFDRMGREMLRRFVADAEAVTLDGNGRFLVPRRYLKLANIDSDVRFIGMDDTIEIWNQRTADSLLDLPDEEWAEQLETLMNPIK